MPSTTETRRCARCRSSLRHAYNQPIHYSSLCGSWGAELCCSCGAQEEKAIAEAGTNSLPELVKGYHLSKEEA
jgi:hypothetical protein